MLGFFTMIRLPSELNIQNLQWKQNLTCAYLRALRPRTPSVARDSSSWMGHMEIRKAVSHSPLQSPDTPSEIDIWKWESNEYFNLN